MRTVAGSGGNSIRRLRSGFLPSGGRTSTPSQYRDRTLAELVVGGVTDHDPMLYLTQEDLTHG